MESEDQVPESLQAISDEIPDYFFYLIFQASRQREIAFDGMLADAGLNMNRLRILSVIQKIDACTMKDLARLTAIDRTTLTRAVDQLVDQGLVERCTPADDRRKVQLTLSTAGEAVRRAAVRLINLANRRALDGISRKQQIAVVEAIHRVILNISGDRALARELITFGGAARHREVAA